MSEAAFVIYRKFNDAHAAGELAQLLTAHGLVCELEDANSRFDPSFAYNQLSKDFRVKLAKADFGRADEVVQQYYESGYQPFRKITTCSLSRKKSSSKYLSGATNGASSTSSWRRRSLKIAVTNSTVRPS